MAIEANLQLDATGLKASADLSTKQYYFVNVNSSKQVAVNTTAGGFAYGVLQDKPDAAGKVATVATGGVSKVIAGGSFDAGAQITSDNAGKAVLATTDDIILGTAMAAGASGAITSIHLHQRGAATS